MGYHCGTIPSPCKTTAVLFFVQKYFIVMQQKPLDVSRTELPCVLIYMPTKSLPIKPHRHSCILKLSPFVPNVPFCPKNDCCLGEMRGFMACRSQTPFICVKAHMFHSECHWHSPVCDFPKLPRFESHPGRPATNFSTVTDNHANP
jgi:hypothetical protein